MPERLRQMKEKAIEQAVRPLSYGQWTMFKMEWLHCSEASLRGYLLNLGKKHGRHYSIVVGKDKTIKTLKPSDEFYIRCCRIPEEI